MAFKICKIKSSVSLENIASALRRAIATSRFTARVETERSNITIHDVRLIEKKHYCGNHPLPCPVRAVHVPHKRMNFLEGADWVAFNDMVNDVLDALEISANAGSSLVKIRKGDSRCIEYTPYSLGNGANEWQNDSHKFMCCIGKQAPRSQYPNGTPGIPEYLPSLAATYTIIDHAEHSHAH